MFRALTGIFPRFVAVAVLAMGLCTVADQALAMSAACTAINSDWGSGPYITIAQGGRIDDVYPYTGFENGEKIVYSSQSTGPGGGINNFASVTLYTADYTTLYDVDNNEIANWTLNGNLTFDGSAISEVSISTIVVNRGVGNNGFTLTITCTAAPAASFTFSPTPGNLPDGVVGTDPGGSIAASGGTYPYSYSATGSLPPGVTINSDGTFTGTPTTDGSYTFTVTATDSAATPQTGSAIYTRVINTAPAANATLSPGSGALTGATVGASYNQTITATGGTGPYSYLVTTGTLPDDLVLNASTGIISGIPEAAAAGSHSFTITATDHNGASASANYTLAVAATVPDAPVIGSASPGNAQATVSFTPPANDGGAAIIDYTIVSSPDAITATGSASPITVGGLTNNTAYTFTVKARNTAGTGAASLATAAVTPVAGLAAPTVSVSPSSANPAAGTSVTLTATLASAVSPTGIVTFKNGATVLGTGTISGTTATFSTSSLPVGSYSVTAEYEGDGANAAATSTAITVTVGQAAPTLSVSASSAAAQQGTPITFTATLTGAVSPTGTVTFRNGATVIGTGTISGTTATFSTSSLPAGTYSLTAEYGGDSTNAAATSAAASVTISGVVVTVTLSPADGALSGGTVGAVYSAAVTASGGASPYSYTSGGLPAGLSIDAATGAISGTPAQAGSFSVAVSATDANGVAGYGTYTLTVETASVKVPLALVSGSLAPARVAVAYGDAIAASGGTAPYVYSASGLPDGITLDASSGALSGTPARAGDYTVTVTATDSTTPANTASATYSLTVAAEPVVVSIALSPSGGALAQAMAGEDYRQSITATGGTLPHIFSLASGSLPEGMVLNVSTGELAGALAVNANGNYSFTIGVTDAANHTATAAYTLAVGERAVTVTDKVVAVEPGSAPVDVYLNHGATGGPFVSSELTFVEPPNAGTAQIIRGQLAQATPAITPVGWYLQFTPNPAYSGQVRVGFRLTSALGISNTGTITYNIAFAANEAKDHIDALVHGFVQTRQSLIASTLNIPGLAERRRMDLARDPVTTRIMPSGSGLKLGFSTSLAQMEAARNGGGYGASGRGHASPFNIWIDGTFLVHNRKDNGNQWGSFGMVSLGADYLLTEKALIGLSFHYDRTTDPTSEDAELTGSGWLAGPNASFEIGKGVFWDTSLLYGGSANDIDTAFLDGSFDTTRWLFDTAIKGQWNAGDSVIITPKLRAVYFSEKVDAYGVKNASGDALAIDGFTAEQFRVSLGAEIARSFVLHNDAVLTPKIGASAGVAGLDGSGTFGSLSAGVSLETADLWELDFSMLFNIADEGAKSSGARIAATKRF